MTTQSQSQLERDLALRWDQNQKGELDLKQAFGNFDEWSLELGRRRAFLHPNLKRWMWYERSHDEWVPTGCGPGEGILLTFGSTAGMKKLPQPGPIDDWCVYQTEGKPFGPILSGELCKMIANHEIPPDSLVWSTRAVEWLRIHTTSTGGFSLIDEMEKTVLTVDDQGRFVEPGDAAKSARKGKRS
ncbi:MAG: GYF domain-containing protein [Anaerolineaceae bacterium]